MIEKLIIQFWSTIWKYYAKAGLWPERPSRWDCWLGRPGYISSGYILGSSLALRQIFSCLEYEGYILIYAPARADFYH